jgi:glucose-6-phosphate 1-dehydrogenase
VESAVCGPCANYRGRNRGLEGRAGYYETAGALRDMVQNHLMQLFCLTAMEAPNSLDADSIRSEKVKVLQATHLADLEDFSQSAVRGQYAPGWMKGKSVPAIGQKRGPVMSPPPPPTPPSSCWWITGAGRGCPFTCAPASGCPRRSRRFPSTLKKCRS